MTSRYRLLTKSASTQLPAPLVSMQSLSSENTMLLNNSAQHVKAHIGDAGDLKIDVQQQLALLPSEASTELTATAWKSPTGCH